MSVDVQQVLRQTAGIFSGHTVFGEPIERDGTTVVTAARIRGGGGGGSGSSPAENGRAPQSGWGGGGSAVAEPVGAFVIAGGDVRWLPAVDVTTIARRAVVALALVALAGIRLARKRQIAVTVNRGGQAARP